MSRVSFLGRLGSGWERFWFPETPLVRLAAFRILVLAVALYGVVLVAPFNLRQVDGAMDRGGWNPIYAFEVLGIGPPDPAAARTALALFVAATLLGLLGVFTRIACAVAALLFFYWVGLQYSYDQAHHDTIALTFAMLALPLSAAGARLSFDALAARRRRRGAQGPGNPGGRAESSELAGWPIRLTQVTVALGYFFAGASKLVLSGPAWLNGYSLQATILGGGGPWSELLARSVPACAAMAAGTLLVQLTFPVVFLVPAARWFYLPAVTGFHLVTWQTGITATPFIQTWMIAIAAFVPLERTPAWLLRQLTTGTWLRRAAVAVVAAAMSLLLLGLFLQGYSWM